MSLSVTKLQFPYGLPRETGAAVAASAAAKRNAAAAVGRDIHVSYTLSARSAAAQPASPDICDLAASAAIAAIAAMIMITAGHNGQFILVKLAHVQSLIENPGKSPGAR
jgi:hypothetical protein